LGTPAASLVYIACLEVNSGESLELIGWLMKYGIFQTLR
jgi:hypothetical protein